MSKDCKESLDQQRINKRMSIALPIYQKLMERRMEDGYTDKGAINESFRLADNFIMMGNSESYPGTTYPCKGIIIERCAYEQKDDVIK